MGPTLSVVVPTLNEARALPRLVESLASPGPGKPGESRDPIPAPHELVVVDGGSDDDTVAIARAANARVVRAERGRGPQLRAGAAAASGELLLFLHADCRVQPGALAALGRAFADASVGAAGMHQRIDHDGRFYRFVERAANARVRRGVVYGDSGLCVRRALYEDVGGFRDLAVFEDLDLARRLRRRARVVLVPDAGLVVSARRWEEEGRLRRTFLNWGMTLAWRAGVPSARLVRYYPNYRRGEDPGARS